MSVNEYFVLKYIAKHKDVLRSELLSTFKNAAPIIETLKDKKFIFEDVKKVKTFSAYNIPYIYNLTLLGFNALHEFQTKSIKLFIKCLIAAIPVAFKLLEHLIG